MIRNSKLTKSLSALIVICLFFVTQAAAAGNREMLDFSDCVILTSEEAGKIQQKAVTVLQEEIHKRTGIKPKVIHSRPAGTKSVIAVLTKKQAKNFPIFLTPEMSNLSVPGPEGFFLMTKSIQAVVSDENSVGQLKNIAVILAEDGRGFLYGVGKLLRKMQMREGSILVPDKLNIITSPKYPLRGHQLGYRPKTNAYDAWTPEQFDQYIRELVLFGTNAIEIIPPVSDDRAISAHMKVEPMKMMQKMSEIIKSYGLEVWIWYPNVGDDYTGKEAIKKELAEREDVLSKLPYVDVVFVPGGDPGDLHSDDLFKFLDKTAPVLKKYHPDATIWVSPQQMEPTREWLREFYKNVNRNPSWFGGVVFGPWIKTPLPEMRKIVDKDIKIRRYPDITHNVACQYPVRNWDLAFALTLHRECFNPRPVAMKYIHNLLDEYSCGSLTYSEGINDDINKFIWSDQDWDPDTEVIETLRDYSRLFISCEYADELAHGFMAQEKNWEGPLAVNNQVDVTFRQWRQLEKQVPKKVKQNYRFEMGLLRAYYDAYIKRRLIYETELEEKATEVLCKAESLGALKAIQKSEKILRRAKTNPVAQDYKARCWELADSLFKKIGAQLSVEKHQAQHRTRGAFMDGIDEPLNNSAWLASAFEKVRDNDDEKSRLKAIEQIINRTNPGTGGFYDNMGAPGSLERIAKGVYPEYDPGTLESPRIAFYYKVDRPGDKDFPLAWKNQATTLYETPLIFTYDNLDPSASYTIKVAYTGRRGDRVRLTADDKYPVHDLVETMEPPVRQFRIPKEATEDGSLKLTWSCGEGERGSQVSEIWLIKEEKK